MYRLVTEALAAGQLDLTSALAAHGSAVALEGEKARFTYLQLADAACEWRDRLQRSGLDPGARIAVHAANSPKLATFLYGAWAAGLLVLILDARTPPVAARRAATELACARVVTDTDLRLLDQMGARAGAPVDVWSPATATMTSGSTGRPRAVTHCLANHLHSAIGAASNMPIGPRDRWLLALPLSHVAGLSILFRCFLAGATALVARSASLRDDDAIRLLPRATVLSVVPAQLERVMAVAPRMRRRLRWVLVGGQAIPRSPMERARASGLRPVPTYGSTEMASQITTGDPDGRTPPGCSGSVLPRRELRIVDGVIQVRGPTLFMGYATERGLEPAPIDQQGWFTTGDCGRLDERGRLHVVGRRDAMFVAGGENIHPEEVEAVLAEHPAIASVVVVPAPDAEVTLRPVAFIAVDGATPPLAELSALLAVHLPRFKHPVRYYPLRAQRRALGKPERARLTALARKPHNLRAMHEVSETIRAD